MGHLCCSPSGRCLRTTFSSCTSLSLSLLHFVSLHSHVFLAPSFPPDSRTMSQHATFTHSGDAAAHSGASALLASQPCSQRLSNGLRSWRGPTDELEFPTGHSRIFQQAMADSVRLQTGGGGGEQTCSRHLTLRDSFRGRGDESLRGPVTTSISQDPLRPTPAPVQPRHLPRRPLPHPAARRPFTRLTTRLTRARRPRTTARRTSRRDGGGVRRGWRTAMRAGTFDRKPEAPVRSLIVLRAIKGVKEASERQGRLSDKEKESRPS